MSLKDSKAVVRKFLKSCSAPTGDRVRRNRYARDPAAKLEKDIRSGFSRVLASDYIEHGPRSDMTFEELIQRMVSLKTAFPDLTYKAEDMVAGRDKVVMRYSARGTHLGNFMDVPPSRKKIRIDGIYIARMAGGKITEGWYASNIFSAKEIFEQLRLFLSKKR
jgi:predicted ester cyclase